MSGKKVCSSNAQKILPGGFTLVELVMVIVIISVLAAVSLPRFVNLKTTAIVKTDDSVIGSLRSAVKINAVSYWTTNPEATDLPAVNPFTFMEKSPPYLVGDWAAGSQDNETWRVHFESGWTAFYLGCPHYTGDYHGNNPTKGYFYIYIYGNNPFPGWGSKIPGEITVSNYGH